MPIVGTGVRTCHAWPTAWPGTCRGQSVLPQRNVPSWREGAARRLQAVESEAKDCPGDMRDAEGRGTLRVSIQGRSEAGHERARNHRRGGSGTERIARAAVRARRHESGAGGAQRRQALRSRRGDRRERARLRREPARGRRRPVRRGARRRGGAGPRRVQRERSGAGCGRGHRPGGGRAGDRDLGLRGLPRRAPGRDGDARARLGLDPVHRRLGQREGLSGVGLLRHGQVRAAGPRAEHGARDGAEGDPRRALRHRRGDKERRAGFPTTTSGSIRMRSRRPISTSTASIAARGHGRSS